MIYFILLIPVILAVGSLLIFKHKITWFEVLIPILASLIIMSIMQAFMVSGLTSDTEYLSEYPIEARYYEKWDEYIDDTCECCCDEDGNCSTYDCSYTQTHYPYWEIKTNIGNVKTISETYYVQLKKKWGNEVFRDMRRDYDNIDGDQYYTTFDNVFEHIEPITFKGTYTNKTQASRNVFKFQELDSTDRVGLYDYPNISSNGRQENCLGCDYRDNTLLERYNALLGSKHEIKVFILVYPENKSIEIAERQFNYWEGGNMNELVICTNKNFDWVKTFSWCDDKYIESKSNQIFSTKLSMKNKIIHTSNIIQNSWKRKDIEKDFDYLEITITNSQTIWLIVVTIIISILSIIWAVKNEFEQL